MGSDYERELKGILAGDGDTLRRTTRTLDPEEEKHYRHTEASPFLVVRGAGSLGVDLVALRGDLSFPIEVKASSQPTVHFSDASGAYNDQAEEMARTCARSGVLPIYAFRLKGQRGDAWRIFSLPMEGLRGRQGLLYDRVPDLERTDAGFFVLRWGSGLPLHRFFAYLAHLNG